MARIYYVGARLSEASSARLAPGRRLHATIAYSREWFPYRPARDLYPLVVVPPFAVDALGNVPVLRFADLGLTRRHEELLAAGATWDYPDFKSHVSLPARPFPEFVPPSILVLEDEYYQTWEE